MQISPSRTQPANSPTEPPLLRPGDVFATRPDLMASEVAFVDCHQLGLGGLDEAGAIGLGDVIHRPGPNMARSLLLTAKMALFGVIKG
jgi:hypothetical protein